MIGLEFGDLAVDGCITKAPCGGDVAGRSPVDRGEQGRKRSTVTEARGIPLGTVAAAANRNDSPLLGPTLDTTARLGSLPQQPTVHLDRGYDSGKTRAELAEHGMTGQIAERASRRRSTPASDGRWSGPTPGATSSRSWSGIPNAPTRSSTRSWHLPTRSSRYAG
jgi:Transposase DDE domain